MEDFELILAENKELNKRIDSAIKELNFAIKFAKSRGQITEDILMGIKSRLISDGYLKSPQ